MGLIELILIVLFLQKIDLKGSNNKIDRKNIRKVFPYTFAMFWVMVIFYALSTNFSIIITKESIVPTAFIGVFMAIQNLVAFIVGMKLRIFVRCFNEKLKYIGTLIFMTGFFFMGFGASVIFISIGLVLIGMGFGIMVPLLNSQIALNVEK